MYRSWTARADGVSVLRAWQFPRKCQKRRLFLALRKETSVKGGKVIVRNISDNIRQVFMMTGFLNMFEIQ